jgi:hypothetical protein
MGQVNRTRRQIASIVQACDQGLSDQPTRRQWPWRERLWRRWSWAEDGLGQPRTSPKRLAAGARSVPLVDVWALPETGYARTAGGVSVVHQVVGAPRLDVVLVGDGLGQVQATWEICVRGTVQHWSRLALSARGPRGAARRPVGPCRFIRSAARSIQVPSCIYLTGAGPSPILGTGADGMPHLYDHADVVRELGRRARARVTGRHDATVAAASLGEGVPPRPVREPTDEP